MSKIDGTALYSLYPMLLTSYVTTNGSHFCPGHKFPFLESLFCGWACQLLDKYKRSIKIFIWSWHNVQLRLKLGYSGQSYIFSFAGTDWDSKGAAVTCSQLRAQGQHNRLFLMPNVFWFLKVRVRSGWLMPRRMRKYFTTWEFRICKGQALILSRVTAEGRAKPWPIPTSWSFQTPCTDYSASLPAGYSCESCSLGDLY